MPFSDLKRGILNRIELFCDGACKGNQEEENTGGYGALLLYGKHEKEISGGTVNTTNNIMEMTAMLEGLRAIKRVDIPVVVYGDSAYLLNGLKEKWYVTWRRNGWKTKAKTPVENRALWEELLEQVERFDSISYRKIKGHLSTESPTLEKWFEKYKEEEEDVSLEEFLRLLTNNARVDKLASEFALQLQDSRTSIGE